MMSVLLNILLYLHASSNILSFLSLLTIETTTTKDLKKMERVTETIA